MKLINLFAFILPIVIFIYWGLIGYATLTLLRTQRYTLQNVLLAPAIGISITLLPLFWLNHAGLPVKSFASLLTIFLLISSIWILYKKNSLFPIRKYSIFFIILLIGLFLTGRPLLLYGFDWMSYCNDDMANYCLGAKRLLEHGYTDIPDLNRVISKEYNLLYWFLHVIQLVRPGSDLILAWVSGTTKISPLNIFMPTILAMHLTLISATGALIYRSKKFYYIGVWACLLLACSAMITLGTLFQLIAQVGGLTLLIASLVLMLDTKAFNKFSLSSTILYSIVLSALLIIYPEVSPFFVLSFILYFSISIYYKWKLSKAFFKTLLLTFVLTIIELNTYILDVSVFFLHQIQRGRLTNIGIENILFPYYLLPSGLANLWGLQPVSVYSNLNISILAGALLLLFTILLGTYLAFRRRNITAIVFFIMVCLGFQLFFRNIDYGLFKLAMYIQPFILSVFIVASFEIIYIKKIKYILIISLIFINLIVQNEYVRKSQGLDDKKGGWLPEIKYASNTKINKEFIDKISQFPNDKLIISDTQNITLAKFQAINAENRNLIFLVKDYFQHITYATNYFFNKKYHEAMFNILAERNKSNVLLNFDFYNKDNILQSNKFSINNISSNDMNNAILVSSTDKHSIFNINKIHTTTNQNFIVTPINLINNHLIFVNSEYGNHYFLSSPRKTAMHHIENDIYYPDKKMASIGRYFLFLILNPTTQPKLLVSFTSSLNGDGKNELPKHATIIGNKVVSIPFMGRGSGRVFSESFDTKQLNSLSFIMLDMGKDIVHFPQIRFGLQNLYGKNIFIDRRMTIGFVREISIYTQNEYLDIKAPKFISKFPEDLANRNLEYSGIYEDGWVSEDSFYYLQQAEDKSNLIIKGFLPEIDGADSKSMLTILVDGKVIHQQTLTNGAFQIRKPILLQPSRHRVELHFSRIQNLPKGDNRPVSAKLDFIGFIA